MTPQLDLFAPESAITDAALRHEAHFGKWDAKSGLGIRNYYTKKLRRLAPPHWRERLAAYERAFRAERAVAVGREAPSWDAAG